jgi:uncharacterized protein
MLGDETTTWRTVRSATHPEGTPVTCLSCGAVLETTATACPVCGAAVPPSTVGTAVAAQSTAGAEGAAQPSAPPPTWSAPAPHPSGLPSDVRGWGIAAHLAGLGAALLTAAVFGFLGPLLVWLLKRDQHPFVEHHAKEALNFQLSVLVYLAGAAVLAIPAIIVGVLTLGVGLVALAILAAAAVVAWFALPIVAAVKASNGEGFRYPLTIRFVS